MRFSNFLPVSLCSLYSLLLICTGKESNTQIAYRVADREKFRRSLITQIQIQKLNINNFLPAVVWVGAWGHHDQRFALLYFECVQCKSMRAHTFAGWLMLRYPGCLHKSPGPFHPVQTAAHWGRLRHWCHDATDVLQDWQAQR